MTGKNKIITKSSVSIPLLNRQFRMAQINYAHNALENLRKNNEQTILGIKTKDITIYPLCKWIGLTKTTIHWIELGKGDECFGDEFNVKNINHLLLIKLLRM